MRRNPWPFLALAFVVLIIIAPDWVSDGFLLVVALLIPGLLKKSDRKGRILVWTASASLALASCLFLALYDTQFSPYVRHAASSTANILLGLVLGMLVSLQVFESNAE
jgi:hypothetical protein